MFLYILCTYILSNLFRFIQYIFCFCGKIHVLLLLLALFSMIKNQGFNDIFQN